MLVIPAIDLRNGKCVRLIEGRLDQETIYSDDPIGMAQTFEGMGAQRLHLVDLDGAFSGQMANLDIIRKIVQGIKIPVQLGGGIRTMESIEKLLELGVSRVILGTAAISNLDLVQKSVDKFGCQIMVGIDSKNGQVAIEGWAETVGKTFLELGHEIRSLGVTQVVFTDTRRDGTFKGPNLAASVELARTCDLEVIVSGGVSSFDDIRQIRQLDEPSIVGVIMGKALYAGKVDLKEAIRIGRGEEG